MANTSTDDLSKTEDTSEESTENQTASESGTTPEPQTDKQAEENGKETAQEGQATTQPVATEQTPMTAQGTQTPAVAEPLTIKKTLSAVHNDLESLITRVRQNGVMQVHKDLGDLVDKLDEARLWVAQKLVKYDPSLAQDLGVEEEKENTSSK